MKDANARSLIERALHAHGPALRRYVAARALAPDVDDILQIAAMRAVEKAGGLRDEARVLPWLFSIHRTVMIDVGRKSASDRRLKDALAAEPSPAATAGDDPSCGCSIAQVRQLKTQYASILNLVDIGGASLKEAARKLDITVNAASVRLHRARKALKQRLLDHCGVSAMRDCFDCQCSYDGCCAP